jgi:hypothetical protein
MKQIIRLTETDLHNIIKESVKKILKETRGFVPHDGNGMVGGYYDSWQREGSCNVATPFLTAISEFIDEDTYQQLENYVYENEDAFTINASFTEGYDESVGYGSSNMPMSDLDDINNDDVEGAKQYLAQFPTNPQMKQIIIQTFDKLIDKLDASDFEMYDNDY